MVCFENVINFRRFVFRLPPIFLLPPIFSTPSNFFNFPYIYHHLNISPTLISLITIFHYHNFSPKPNFTVTLYQTHHRRSPPPSKATTTTTVEIHIFVQKYQLCIFEIYECVYIIIIIFGLTFSEK